MNAPFSRSDWSGRLLWVLPPLVLAAVALVPEWVLGYLAAGVVGLAILAWAACRPGAALGVLAVFVPLQDIGFGFLLSLHVPSALLRPAGGIKEMLALGILLAGLHRIHTASLRLDRIDRTLLAYVAVVSVYVLVPHLFTTIPVTSKWDARLLSWRADCGYALLFFGVRHAPISALARRCFATAVMALAALTVMAAGYQWARPDAWARFIAGPGQQLRYQLKVLGNSPTTVQRNLGYLVDRNPLRVGSIFLGPFEMADFLLVAYALAIERITRQHRSWSSYLLCAGVAAALFASRVRADALAVIVITVVALAPAPQRPAAARWRLVAAVLVTAAILIPSLGGTRFTNSQGGAASTHGHVGELSAGINQLVSHPLGLGIANVAGIGDRFVLPSTSQGGFTVDNSVLQVGDELGIQALVPWLLMLVFTWLALGRAAREGDAFAGGVRLAFAGILIAGMYHHVFLNFSVSWVLWAAVGLALTPGAVESEQASNIGTTQAGVGRG